VVVQFVVDEQGTVTDPTVIRSVHRLLDQAAVRAVKKLDCTPGVQRNTPVKVRLAMPVVFRLKDRSR
jgi:TonB family protein